MRAQVQLIDVPDPHGARLAILEHRQEIIDIANSRDRLLLELGGGCRDIHAHIFTDTSLGHIVIFTLIVDVRDAMRATTEHSVAQVKENVSKYVKNYWVAA